MGVVYEATDLATGKRVALKALLRPDDATQELFEREYLTLAQLQHPRIIEVRDYGVSSGTPYYTMELLAGEDLRTAAPVDYRQACAYLRDVAASLALLHARRLLHRDVSPRNIRCTDDGRAKLIDFGALHPFGTATHVVGTPPCIAPEALRGEPLDARSDLFGLGASAYWTLTGRYAYPATRLAELPPFWEREVPPPSRLVPGIPEALDALVMSLIHPEPLRRPASAAEVIDRLGAIAGIAPDTGTDAWLGYLRMPELVGRDREMGRIAGHVDHALAGQPRSVLVEGATGVGRSRLLDEAAHLAQVRGATVVQVGAAAHPASYGVARAIGRALLQALPDTAKATAAAHVHVLGHLLPELLPLAGGPLRPPPEDPSEQRARTQDALTSWVLAIAAREPLALCVDDLHVADDNSVAMLAVLPFVARDERLLLVASECTDAQPRAPEALKALREGSHRMRLRGLEREQTEALVRTLFGGAAHGTRLAHWLQDRTEGHPLHALELVHHLVRQDIVRYVEGSWILPQSIADAALPRTLEEALAKRLDGLGADALELARSMSVEAGAFSLERVAAAVAKSGPDAVREAAHELVRHEVWAREGDRFRYRQEPLRHQLSQRLSERAKREVHGRIGSWRMRGLDLHSDPEALLDAGHHLVKGGDEARGADILAWAATKLWKRVEGNQAAAVAAETALEVFDRQERPLRNKMPVLTILAMAGWFVNWRYSQKYGDRALEMGAQVTGMNLARRLGPILGAKLALVVGIVAGLFGHLFKRHQVLSARRSFQEVMTNFFTAAATRLGVVATCLDVATVESTLAHLEPLRAFSPRHPGGMMYRFYRQLLLTVRGEEAKAIALGEELLELLADEEHWLKHLEADAYRGIKAGVLLALGQLSNMRDVGAGLDYAQRLEALDLAFYKGSIAQLRLMNHAIRGELEEAGRLRQEVDALAVQGGAVWQSEINVTVSMNKVYQQTGDLMGLKQTVRQLERWAAVMPSMRPYLLCSQAAYALEKGDFDTAIARYEEGFEQMPAGESVGWADARGHYARALLAKGQPERARQVCLASMDLFRPEDMEFVQHYVEVQRALALAEAQLGDTRGAAARLDALLERYENCGPVTLAILHQARARVALREGDRATYVQHLRAMEAAVRPTRNAAMMRQVELLLGEGERALGPDEMEGVRPTGLPLPPSRSVRHIDLTELRSLLEACLTVEERARMALRALQAEGGAVRAYLYGRDGERLLLLAQTDTTDPPQDLTARVEAAIEKFLAREQEETTSTLTSSVGSAGRTGGSGAADPFHLVVLHTMHDRAPVVVGAAALERSADRTLDPIPLDMVELVARSFFDGGELSGHGRQAS
jgi:tetratricopeptide (TPR) repeat protein